MSYPQVRCIKVAFLMSLIASSLSPSTHADLKPITSVEGITEYQLDNGLQVLLFPDPSASTITINVTYRVGSRHEGRGEAGMAHLLEHMVFKGTPDHPNIWGALEDHGASFNGTTWVDRTNYFETLPASDENLEFALRMEADRMVNSAIREEDLAKEMTVVRNEFEMGENSPTSVLSERMLSAAYLWHNYGKSTIGNRSDIERVPIENLRRFYRTYYQPDNATLLLVGNFNPERALQLIQQNFGSIPRPERKLDQSYTEEPAQDGSRLVTLKRVGDVAAAGVVYHIPAGTHPDFPAVAILEDILTNEPTGKLYRGLVVPGLASSVSGSAFGWAEPGVIEFMAQVEGSQSPQAVLDYMVDILENQAAASITDNDVETAKARFKKAIQLGMKNTAQLGIRLSEFIAQGDWRLFFVHRDRLEKVTTEDVRNVAKKYLRESNRTAGLFIPTKEPSRVAITPAPEVSSLVSNYVSSHELSAGEQLVPDVAWIEKRVQRVKLPSGIKLAMLPIETRGDSVSLSLQLHYGTEESLQNTTTAEGLISPSLMRGTKKRNYEQLRDEIDRLQSQIMVGGGGGGGRRRGGGGGGGGSPGTESAFIVSDRAHLGDAITLLGEILQQPAFEPQEFEMLKKSSRSRLEQGLSDPNMLGFTALRRALHPWPSDSIHYVPTVDERIERLDATNLQAVKDVYQNNFSASDMEIAIVGDFDVDETVDVINRVFGGWKSPSKYERVVTPFHPVKEQSLTIHTPDKEMAMVAMATLVQMRDDDPRYPAMVLASYVLGESAKSRLMTRLRHEGGLSYGAGGSFSAGSQDDVASLSAMAICAPANAAKARQAMREEIERWIKDGITPEELADAKQSYAQQFERSLGNSGYVLSELASGLEIDRTLEFRKKLMQQIESLTVEDIRDALQDTLGDAEFVTVVAGDVPQEEPKL